MLYVQAFGEVRTLYTSLRMRGLVLVVYYDLRAAVSALGTLQGTLVRNQPLEIHYYRGLLKQGLQESGVNQVRDMSGGLPFSQRAWELRECSVGGGALMVDVVGDWVE